MKKIDKRACRKFDTQKLQIRPNHGLLHAPGIAYIVRTTVQSIAKKRLLILCYFPVQKILVGILEPRYVVFQGKDGFLTLEHLDNGKTKWRETPTAWLDSISYDINDRSAFYSGVDEGKVIRFCGQKGKSGFNALFSLQKMLTEKRQYEKRLQTRKGIAKTMQPVNKRNLPKGLLPWLEWEHIPAHIFYDYRKGKKIHEGYCTRCKTNVLVESPRHAKEGVCPNCKAEVTFHAIGRHSHVMESDTAQVVQHIGEQLVVRIVKIYVDYRNYRDPHISLWESARYLCGVQKGSFFEKEFFWSYNGFRITNWKKGSRPVYNRWYYNFPADNCAYLYPKNLAKELKGTPWQYCQIAAFNHHFGKRLKLTPYLSKYHQKPVLEYLVKLKLFNLAKEFVYGTDGHTFYHKDPVNSSGKRMQDVLGVGKEYLPMLQRMDINGDGLYLLQKLSVGGTSVEEWFLRWCLTSKIYDDRDILRCLRYGSTHKLVSYITAQVEKLKGRSNNEYVFHLYKDYIRFCEALDFDLTDNFILYPRNVQEAHDNTSKLFDQKKMQVYNERIAAAYPELCRKYEMTDHGLRIVPPKSADEIVAEGHGLHHCVGGYVARVVDQESVILFLRNEEQPETPFYTIEVKDGNVAQVRGQGNCTPTPEVDAYMKLWKQEKLLPAMREAA